MLFSNLEIIDNNNFGQINDSLQQQLSNQSNLSTSLDETNTATRDVSPIVHYTSQPQAATAQSQSTSQTYGTDDAAGAYQTLQDSNHNSSSFLDSPPEFYTSNSIIDSKFHLQNNGKHFIRG